MNIHKLLNRIFIRYLVDDHFYEYATNHNDAYNEFYDHLQSDVVSLIEYNRGRRKLKQYAMGFFIVLSFIWIWPVWLYYWFIYKKKLKERQTLIIESDWFENVLEALAYSYCKDEYVDNPVGERYKKAYTALKLTHLLVVKEVEMQDADVNKLIYNFSTHFLSYPIHYTIAYQHNVAYRQFIQSLTAEEKKRLGIIFEDEEVKINQDNLLVDEIEFLVKQPEFTELFKKFKIQYAKNR